MAHPKFLFAAYAGRLESHRKHFANISITLARLPILFILAMLSELFLAGKQVSIIQITGSRNECSKDLHGKSGAFAAT